MPKYTFCTTGDAPEDYLSMFASKQIDYHFVKIHPQDTDKMLDAFREYAMANDILERFTVHAFEDPAKDFVPLVLASMQQSAATSSSYDHGEVEDSMVQSYQDLEESYFGSTSKGKEIYHD